MTETETITETPLFRSTHAALWFAYTFDGDERKNSTLAKLQDQVEGKTYPKGRGLKGLDGAGQVGFIKKEVAALGDDESAIIAARFAPAMITCDCGRSCCTGTTPNSEFKDAVHILAELLRREVLGGTSANDYARKRYVARYLEKKDQRCSMVSLAGDLNFKKYQTASDHFEMVMHTLRRLEAKTMAQADMLFRELGWVGDIEK